MSYAPCENPSCKSYGKPHPNCRCHNELARGGEVSFCSKKQKHKNGCQYFQDGGMAVPSEDLPNEEAAPSMAVPQEDIPENTAPPSAAVPAADLPDGGDEANNNLSPADLQAKMVEAAHPGGPTEYESPGQQALGAVEGAAQGLAGPLAPLIETKVLGVPKEDIVRRAEDNPGGHAVAEGAAFVGGMLTGSSEAAMALKAVEKAAEYARLGKVGAAAMKGFIGNGIIQGGDEVSKAILGQGDPNDAFSPLIVTGISAVLGAAMGASGAKLGSVIGEGIEGTIFNKSSKIENFLSGIGHAAEGKPIPQDSGKSFSAGARFYQDIPKRIGEGIGSYVGHKAGGTEIGYLVGRKLEPIIAKLTNRPVKYVMPTVVRWLSEGAQGNVMNMIDYANKVDKGTSLINKTMNALFTTGTTQAIDAAKPSDLDVLRGHVERGPQAELNQEMQNQHNEPQGYAKGGDVKHNPENGGVHSHMHLAQTFPEQNHMMQVAKGRVTNYLSSMRPQQMQSKLAFDDAPDDTEQKRHYEKALDVAVNPLGVLNHVKNGTIEADHLKHLSSMYPELQGHLQKKITERVTQDQLDGKKPDFKTRQGLSMFMGAPLSGEFTMQSIQAAQAVFAKKEPPHDGGNGGAKKNSTSLSKSDRSFLTDDQARMSRQQRSS